MMWFFSLLKSKIMNIIMPKNASPTASTGGGGNPSNNTLTVTQRILSVAQSQLGISEGPKHDNTGPMEKYLQAVGLGPGYSWCMGFVYWCVAQACKEGGLVNPLVKTGGVLRQWNEVPKRYKITKDPKPGDIFIMDFGKGQGHTGFVTKVEGDRIFTIEGNSNDDGSREGYEVCRKPGGRPIKSIKGFIRIA